MRELLTNVIVLVLTATLATIAIVVAVHQPSAPRAGESGPPASQNRWDHDALEILGYVETVRVDNSLNPQFGVTLWDRDRAQPGLNLYNPRDKNWAVLVDMDGAEVHRWAPRSLGTISWTFAELLAGGDLLAILKDDSLVRVSWDSEVVWRVSMRAHHDVAVAPDGSIWALARKDAIISVEDIEIPILGDQLVRLSPDGEVLGIIDLWPHLVGWLNRNRIVQIRAFSDERALLEAVRSASSDDQILEFGTLPDFTHVNSIEIVDRDIPGICSTGDLLLMVRNLNRIVVFDPVAEKIRWSWSGGGIQRPHQPTFIDNDHILLFDNGVHRRWSRVLELDPIRGEIVWQYRGTDQQPFFSDSRGGNQRLPNGNTLITESNRGHVFEVTPRGEIVWEFYTSEAVSDPGIEGMRRSALFRMTRITDPAAFGLDRLLP